MKALDTGSPKDLQIVTEMFKLQANWSELGGLAVIKSYK